MSETPNSFPNPISLIVLAAGMGSRFGGLKQLFPVGFKKQTILEYTLDDAEAIGIKRVVFVIRKTIEAEFREVVLEKIIRRPFEIRLAFQDTYPLPAGYRANPDRTKPFGTGHALLVGMETMKTSSAIVVNADDYYGPNALKTASEAAGWGRNAIIAYPLEKTLSRRGPSCRGIIERDKKGNVLAINDKGDITHANAPKGALANMNLVAVGASIKEYVDQNWNDFCAGGGLGTVDRECALPHAFAKASQQGGGVEVIETQDYWIGISHRDDLQDVDLHIGRLTNT